MDFKFGKYQVGSALTLIGVLTLAPAAHASLSYTYAVINAPLLQIRPGDVCRISV